MKYKLSPPMFVGDLANRIEIDELEIKSMSMTFDPQDPVLSIVFLHKPTGWQHNIVYVDSSAVEFWARTLEPEFDFLLAAVLKKMVTDQKLPPGALIEEKT